MTIGVLSCMLPLTWQLSVLIAIGAFETIMEGVRATQTPAAPTVVHCCGGDKPKSSKSKKPAQQTDKKFSNQVENSEPPKKRKAK